MTFIKGHKLNDGKIPWNKGKKTGQIPWNKGLKIPYRFRLGAIGRVPWNKGMKSKPVSGSVEKKIRNYHPTGASNPNWKGGIRDKKFHKRLRRNRIRNIGGSHTEGEWNTLLAQYDWICPSCKVKELNLTRDHIIPLSRGGSDNIENIQPLCLPCNRSKYTKTIKY